MLVKLYSLTLLIGCSGVRPAAGGTYLPELGPAPLRFLVPAVRVASAAKLPPLPMADEAPSTNSLSALAATNAVATAPEPFGPVGPLEPVAGVEAEPLKSASGEAPIVPGGSPAIATPQMLIEFFQNTAGSTNLPPSATVVPFQPPQSRSSSATYESK